MNEDELIPGVGEALGEMGAELNALDEPEELQPTEELEPEPVEPEPDIADRLYEKLRQDAQAAHMAQMEAQRRQYEELPLEEQYPDGVPVEVVEQRATQRALQVIQVQQTVQDEVQTVLKTYEEKFGPVPVSVSNEIKTALRQIPPQNMRNGLGTEAARYFVAQALENGSYTPSAVKKTVKAPGSGTRQMSAGAGKGIPVERSAEEEMLRSAFPMLGDTDFKEMLSK